MKMTEIVNTKTSWSDAKIGNTVMLKNGTSGVYYGRMHSAAANRYYSESCKELLKFSKSLSYVFVMTDEKGNKSIEILGTAHLSSILDSSEIDAAEAERFLNAMISDRLNLSGYYRHDEVRILSYSPISWKVLDKKLIDPITARTAIDTVSGIKETDQTTLILTTVGGLVGPAELSYYARNGNGEFGINCIDPKCLTNQDPIEYITVTKPSTRYSYNNRNEVINKRGVYRTMNDIKDIKNLELSIKTKHNDCIKFIV